MSILSNLKKQRGAQLEKAVSGLEANSSGKKTREEDTRFWKLKPDDQGNAAAIIRFLPNVHEEDEMPWVKVDSFGFKNESTGKWYFNNSLTTIGKEDPVYKDNGRLWNEVGTEEAKAIVKNRRKNTTQIFNIYVVKDVNHPENEGKVFLFRAGKQIFGMIQAEAKPEEDALGDSKEPVYVWDLWEGANFRFKAYTEAKFLKYDKSTFDSKSEFLKGDEDKIEEVLKQCHKLSQFVAPDQFKSYEDLQKELDRVMGTSNSSSTDSKNSELEEFENMAKKQKEEPVKKVKKEEQAASSSSGDSDSDLDYFRSLLES